MNGIVTFGDMVKVFFAGWACGIVTVFVVGFIAMMIGAADPKGPR